MILVYCDHITPRHRFIFQFILGDMLGLEYRLTHDRAEFVAFSGPKFSYGADNPGSRLHFLSHTLLKENGVREQNIRVTRWQGLPVFFQADGLSAWPFDPFALIFFLVTRYEEYLPFQPDAHGRFPALASLAYREGFLDIPLADILADRLKALLVENFPHLNFPLRTFRFTPSFDIDIAFAHLGKGWMRASAAWLKLLLKADIGQIQERLLTIRGKMDDPFDNYDYQLELAGKYGYHPSYFVLMGDFGKHDRNTDYRGLKFRELIRMLSIKADIGIHPSYRSHLRPAQIRVEKSRLENITGKPVWMNRFHYLRLGFPHSYRNLSELGFTDDYSLGYSNVNGFRAGTATPFLFYDLLKEEATGLTLHPFIFMDSAMADHLKYSPEQALEEAVKLTGLVSQYGGEAIGIWHNYALSDRGPYRGWRGLLEGILSKFANTTA